MLLKKILNFLLILSCLVAIGWGIHFYLVSSQTLSPWSSPEVDNAVVIVVTAPFQPLVTYPDGQKTGFDPVTRSEVMEITKSRYYFQAEESTHEPGAWWLGLTDPPQNFSLQIIGEAGEFYTFGFYSFEKGVQQTQTFSGQFKSDGIAVYQVISAPQNPFPWNVNFPP